MPKTKQRIRSPHPGVVLLKRTLPSGRVAFQARYIDADTGQLRKPLLDAVALSTAQARRLWAVRLSKTLAKRRAELESGASRTQAKPFAEAVTGYLKGAKHRLRGRTLITYGLAIDQLARWAERNGVKSTTDLDRNRVSSFRDHLISRPRRGSSKGGKRGASQDVSRKRSPVSVNRELRTTKTVLNAWRTAGLLNLDRDAISDALKPLPVPRAEPEYLSPAKLDKLLRAALRHDAEVFAATRSEHSGLRPIGSTQRYSPIAPFVTFLLLTGMRRGEALGLTWADVDIKAVDSQGRAVGEIRLRAEDTKTHRARTIGLEVSPALLALLAAMKLRAGRGADTLHVFGGAHPYTVDMVETARDRMQRSYGAPRFDWQVLRSTCATYLTNAPAIFGAATVFLSARQLGHSVTVAERHYLGVHRGIPKDARTLEAAMQLEADLPSVIAAVSVEPAGAQVVSVGGRKAS